MLSNFYACDDVSAREIHRRSMSAYGPDMINHQNVARSVREFENESMLSLRTERPS